MVPPQFTARPRPHPAPADRKRNTGRTRLRLLTVQQSRSERNSARSHCCLTPADSSLEEGWSRLLVFFIAFVFMTLPLFPNKVNKKLRHNAEIAALFFVQYDVPCFVIHYNPSGPPPITIKSYNSILYQTFRLFMQRFPQHRHDQKRQAAADERSKQLRPCKHGRQHLQHGRCQHNDVTQLLAQQSAGGNATNDFDH